MKHADLLRDLVRTGPRDVERLADLRDGDGPREGHHATLRPGNGLSLALMIRNPVVGLGVVKLVSTTQRTMNRMSPTKNV